MSENGEIYTTGKKLYTPAGTDGMDKFHLWFQSLKTWLKNAKTSCNWKLNIKQVDYITKDKCQCARSIL